ncbi:MAG TPA: hypothetical protein VFS65_01365, partial [Candidatus Saccharimonadales bacterium]|nr:hypothetical protein [Candidatus Saccharimonadales bacterium]
FKELIWQKGRELHRDMPWRDTTDPYYILVSELMLQQTQVSRVVPKFDEFIQAFPTLRALAEASLSDVLIVWSGLGYNRRAKFLHASAQMVISEFGGVIPDKYDDLIGLPGIGPNTAGAILAYAFNQPTTFIETNIRTVYFHHFFADKQEVADVELKKVIASTLDHEHPRQWYWALMDYGSYLKTAGSGRLDQSKHYKKQAPLKGSQREVRGQIIKALAHSDMTEAALKKYIRSDERFVMALEGLMNDGLVQRTDSQLHLTK